VYTYNPRTKGTRVKRYKRLFIFSYFRLCAIFFFLFFSITFARAVHRFPGVFFFRFYPGVADPPAARRAVKSAAHSFGRKYFSYTIVHHTFSRSFSVLRYRDSQLFSFSRSKETVGGCGRGEKSSAHIREEKFVFRASPAIRHRGPAGRVVSTRPPSDAKRLRDFSRGSTYCYYGRTRRFPTPRLDE